MIKKIFCFLPVPLIFIFYSNNIIGQDTLKISNYIVDSTIKRENFNNHYLKPAALIIPGTFLVYGGLKPFINGIPMLDQSIKDKVLKNHPGFHTNAADYTMWAPSASVYVMDAFKVKTAHSFKEHLIIDAGSIIITGGIGYGMRIISRNIKVYNTDGTKFPSGHTANAFRGAEIWHQELKNSNKILSYSGYLIAIGTGMLRIYDKDHLFSEVIAGAGLGILSTKLTYFIFDKVKSKESHNQLF
jgi:membrane-associated phospholipid phosphatase